MINHACPACKAAPGQPCHVPIAGVDTTGWEHDARILASVMADLSRSALPAGAGVRVVTTVNTPATLRRVAKPPMVMRSIRVPLRLWNEAKAKADEREENISDVIREALERYVKRK